MFSTAYSKEQLYSHDIVSYQVRTSLLLFFTLCHVMSARQFRVPKFEPSPMNSGGCYSCHREWSSAESTVHFTLDPDVWQQALNKLFEGFGSRDGLDGGYYDYIEASVHTPYNVQNYLVSCVVLTEEQGAECASMLARKL